MKIHMHIAMMMALLAVSCSNISRQNTSATSVAFDYQKLLNDKQHDIADYSFAGYDFGESSLPEEIQNPVFKVGDFGAVPNDEISDIKAIKQAIAAAEAAGGGTVAFESGTYLIHEEGDLKERIIIHTSKVLLKGAGSDEGGTHLFMKTPLDPEDPRKLWSIPAMIQFSGRRMGKEVGPLTKEIKKGSLKMTLTKAEELKKGDIIKISAQGTFLNDQFLKGKKTREKWTNINEKGAYVNELHEVAKVEGKVVTFRAAITLDMSPDEPWLIEQIDFLDNCGVEDIKFVGNFLEPFVHHKNAIHDGGFTGVNMTGTKNSWVRNCVFENVNRAVTFSNSICGTILSCHTIGNGGHGSFGMQRSTRGLIAYCSDMANQWHGPNSSHGSVGTVVFRFTGKNRGIDLHAAFPRITLFDDCEMAGFDGDSVGRASHGGNYINLPNHLDGLVFWNFKQTDRPRPGFNFWDLMEDKPTENYGPLTAVNPILVGFQGEGTSFLPENVGEMTSFGKAVSPASLYLSQLEARGQKIPVHLVQN